MGWRELFYFSSLFKLNDHFVQFLSRCVEEDYNILLGIISPDLSSPSDDDVQKWVRKRDDESLSTRARTAYSNRLHEARQALIAATPGNAELWKPVMDFLDRCFEEAYGNAKDLEVGYRVGDNVERHEVYQKAILGEIVEFFPEGTTGRDHIVARCRLVLSCCPSTNQIARPLLSYQSWKAMIAMFGRRELALAEVCHGVFRF